MEERLAKYPFLPEAQEYVREAGFDINSLIEKPAYSSERQYAVKRIKNAINNNHQPKTTENHIELLSYPISRLIVSCINDHYLTNKIALHESKKFHKRLKTENNETIKQIAQALNIKTQQLQNKKKYKIHFTDYLKQTQKINEKKWKLINQQIKKGNVTLNKKDFTRLLQESIRTKILKELPLNVPEKICQNLKKQTKEIEKNLQKKKNQITINKNLPIKEKNYPPCIQNLITRTKKGENLSHTDRFTLVSFLINIGMTPKEVLNVFKTSPDYDEERTRYQVQHIAGREKTKEYTPPSCKTMKTYNICPEPKGMCEKVSHPLGYYRWKTKTNKQKNND
ncbi:Eukaryotic-type DNA primase large subunit PRI2 [Methanonatronarchaeum thermophilum]|uniref:DNA primase large subunit PriL n=1 Tax=Methanonatronarchaeum thermophilum TaxID=1927129 RepID=A0A1Y3GEX7_9EURY|nr:DNA primase large subunit PriL [Methanonatronarchaeum thermophilum]OUJ18744.1 Eukaryotic-type DNA primase large subunit PRI2 [Methanonatronarchaeum thermophilum]